MAGCDDNDPLLPGLDAQLASDTRTTRHADYAVSLRIRRAEKVFGWMQTVGGWWHTRYRGLARTGLASYLVATAHNLPA